MTIDDQLFGVRRSIRYHERRKRFFEACHTITTLVALLFGSATFYLLTQSNDTLIKAFATIVTITASLDLIIGFSKKASLHDRLKDRFCDLEIIAISTKSEKTVLNKRLEIEKDEPPKMHSLDALCHDELLLAMGYDKTKDKELFSKTKWLPRKFAHIIP